MLFLERRSVDHVNAGVEPVQKLGNLFGWILEIVVEGDSNFVPRFPDPTEECIVLAIISHQPDTSHPWVLGSEGLDDGPDIGPTAVVDKNDLVLVAIPAQDGLQTRNQLGQSFVAIVDRDYDTQGAPLMLCRHDEHLAGGVS